jgi:hypothetical protein
MWSILHTKGVHMSKEEGPDQQTRVFWVLLTVFGGSLTSGIGILLESPLLGFMLLITGMTGLSILVWDRIKAVPVRTPLLVVASGMGALFIRIFSLSIKCCQ